MFPSLSFLRYTSTYTSHDDSHIGLIVFLVIWAVLATVGMVYFGFKYRTAQKALKG